MKKNQCKDVKLIKSNLRGCKEITPNIRTFCLNKKGEIIGGVYADGRKFKYNKSKKQREPIT